MTDIRENPEQAFAVRDPEAFAQNMARLAEEGGKAMAAFLGPRETGEAKLIFAEEMTLAAKTLSQIAEKWLSDPQRAVEAQTRLWTGYLDLWTRALRRQAGQDDEEPSQPAAADKRFADPSWQTHPMFGFLKDAYLLTADWAESIVDQTEDIDEHTRHKAQFYVRQIANAISPSNFVLTNPELLQETLETNGENLVRGMKMLAEDIRLGKGELKIRQSDPTKFEVGKNLALSPGKVIFQNELMQLIQYSPTTETVLKRPFLMVPPWINKFYILDLTPEKSLFRWLIDQGHTVFCISWVNPDGHLARKSFEEYMREGILTAVDIVEEITGEDRINAAGYCVGGTLLAATLAHMAARGDERIASVTLLTAQVDFTHAGDLKVFVDEDQIRAVEEDMAQRGYLEGRRMAMAFNLLRSNDLIWPYMVNNYLRGRAPFPFDLLYWNSDSTHMPAANHSFYLRNCYLENRLSKGEMEIGGERLDLSRIRIPVYNLATREDHIAPAKSVFVGSRFFGGPVRFVLAGSGHIAGVVNPPEKHKYQYWTGPKPAGEYEKWLAKAKEKPGSWWPDWQAWVTKQNKETVPARKPGSRKYKPIEDAPGSYVRKQS
ncbi:class I poly(R)-hydroxyalkanoic acid synthase [Microbaculum marinum]|uniref:Class I poly(R)-hydroxyalkanoic acid synthase n=1 Tax=Microbaculum marinum TaxID=1764581 RepID=A0AAW9RTT9_9HYPH